MTEQEMRKWRKERPVYSGVLSYFPDALLEVAHCSFMGNQQHNPGQPLHWAKEKSTDEPDALVRHMLDRSKGEVRDSDGVRHLAKAAWRALANLQREIEAERTAEVPGAAPIEFAADDEDGCGAYDQGYACTRKLLHKGQHVATVPGGDVVHTWGRKR